MKKTLFLASLLACCFFRAYGATYTDLTNAWCDKDNNVIYDGQGYFEVESASTTSVELTISLDSLLGYVNSNDYPSSGGTYMLLWEDNYYNYGLADTRIAISDEDTTSYNPCITGWTGSLYTGGTTDEGTTYISYEKLSQYATNKALTLYITNSSTDGVSVSTKDSEGNSISLYTASNLKYSSNTATNGYRVNLNYVTAVTLNTVSTLNTADYVPPTDYTQPYVSTRTDGTTIGRVTFLGDSITHGVKDQSYRWQFFKTLVDNGIENEIAGPRKGYFNTPGHTRDAGSNYGGTTFTNVHLAQASGRTYNIITGSNVAAVIGTSKDSGVNYGGHSTAETGEKYDSNTWFCMMGTNDLLSDTDNFAATTDAYIEQMQRMLGGSVEYTNGQYVWTADTSNTGTMGTIVDDVYGDGDTFYMLSITPWGDHQNHNRNEDHYAAQEFNRNLKEWVEVYSANTGKNVVYVDVTRGLVDLTSDISFDSHNAFWNNPGSNGDGLHPNEQGSIIIAGNLARAMGIGGRTAGLARADKNTSSTTWRSATVGTDGHISADETLSVSSATCAFTQDGGYTVDFCAAFGNGSTDGWLDSSSTLSISIGDGINSGTLNLSEGYIMWGDSVLFCQDTSAMDENLRIAWHNGNTADNVLEGYYVWLGDMLIGQALGAETAGGLNGISISATGANGSITDLSWSNTAYAPTTTRTTSTEYAYTTTQAAGESTFITNSGVDYTGAESTTPTKETLVLVTPDTQNTTSYIIQNADSTQVSVWVGMVNTTFSEDITLQHQGNITATIFGTMDSGNAGKLVLDIEEDSTIGSVGTYNGVTAAIAGSYGGGDAEEFNVFVNGGTIGGDVVGGSVNGDGHIDAVRLVFNGGEVNASVYGGSKVADGSVGKADIVVNGGTITGGIVAGGSAGTIGQVEVTIIDGSIEGDITKGTANRIEGATTNVTVIGNKATIGGSIEADTVTLRDVQQSDAETGFHRYAETITATSLVLDNVQTELLATVEVSNIIATNGTNTDIIMGDTATLESLTLDANTTFGAFKNAAARTASTESETTLTLNTLTVGKGATLNANIVLGAESTLRLEDSLTMGSSVSLTSGMVIDLSAELRSALSQGTTITLFKEVDSFFLDDEKVELGKTVEDVKFRLAQNGPLYTFDVSYTAMDNMTNVGSVNIRLVPEPTTATLSLLALAALATRRRRK